MHGRRKAQKNTYQSLNFRNCLKEVEAGSESGEEANNKPHQRPGMCVWTQKPQEGRECAWVETEAMRRPCFKKGHMPSTE